MRLTPDQLDALVELRRADLARAEVEATFERHLKRCWDMGIPAMKIGFASGMSHHAIRRRFAAAYSRP